MLKNFGVNERVVIRKYGLDELGGSMGKIIECDNTFDSESYIVELDIPKNGDVRGYSNSFDRVEVDEYFIDRIH